MDYYEKYQAELLAKSSSSHEVLHKAKKVVLDCDPGGDDAQALILAFHLAKQQGVEILGVTAVAGNDTIDNVIKNAQLTLNICCEKEVPLYKG